MDRDGCRGDSVVYVDLQQLKRQLADCHLGPRGFERIKLPSGSTRAGSSHPAVLASGNLQQSLEPRQSHPIRHFCHTADPPHSRATRLSAGPDTAVGRDAWVRRTLTRPCRFKSRVRHLKYERVTSCWRNPLLRDSSLKTTTQTPSLWPWGDEKLALTAPRGELRDGCLLLRNQSMMRTTFPPLRRRG